MDGQVYNTTGDLTPTNSLSLTTNWSYTSEAYGATYTVATDFYYSYESDMTYSGASSQGTKVYSDGTEISKILYTYVIPSYTVDVTYTDTSTIVYNQPSMQGTATYFLVRSPGGVVFRVLGSASEGRLTASNYFTRFKVLSSSTATDTGLCSSTATTASSYETNLFTTYDSTLYNEQLTANGWSSTGAITPEGAASCYEITLTAHHNKSSAAETCTNNGVQLADARVACVGAMFGAGTDGMLDACVLDWCSFAGNGKIVEQYFIEAQWAAMLDSQFLVSEYSSAAQTDMTQIVQSMVQDVSGYTVETLIADTEAVEAYELVREYHC